MANMWYHIVCKASTCGTISSAKQAQKKYASGMNAIGMDKERMLLLQRKQQKVAPCGLQRKQGNVAPYGLQRKQGDVAPYMVCKAIQHIVCNTSISV